MSINEYHATVKLNKEDKINKKLSKNIVKNGGNISTSDNSVTQIIEHQVINKSYLNGVSESRFGELVSRINEIEKNSRKTLGENHKYFKDVPLEYLYLYWNQDVDEIQVNTYLSNDSVAIKRRKIEVLSKMTIKNYDLYNLLKYIFFDIHELLRVTWYSKNIGKFPLDYTIHQINAVHLRLETIINNYEIKYGKIIFEDIEELESLGLLRSGESRIYYKEMIYKSFVKILLEPDELELYKKETSQKLRNKWTAILYSKKNLIVEEITSKFAILFKKIPLESYRDISGDLAFYWFGTKIL